MLYDIQTMKPVSKLPHERDFQRWCAHMSASDFQAAVSRIDQMISGDEIHTAGWMPGNDWSGTPVAPIAAACGGNPYQSGQFFGLLVFYTVMQREVAWGFGKYTKNGVPIHSMTYFRLKNM